MKELHTQFHALAPSHSLVFVPYVALSLYVDSCRFETRSGGLAAPRLRAARYLCSNHVRMSVMFNAFVVPA